MCQHRHVTIPIVYPRGSESFRYSSKYPFDPFPSCFTGGKPLVTYGFLEGTFLSLFLYWGGGLQGNQSKKNTTLEGSLQKTKDESSHRVVRTLDHPEYSPQAAQTAPNRPNRSKRPSRTARTFFIRSSKLSNMARRRPRSFRPLASYSVDRLAPKSAKKNMTFAAKRATNPKKREGEESNLQCVQFKA